MKEVPDVSLEEMVEEVWNSRLAWVVSQRWESMGRIWGATKITVLLES